MNVRRGTCVHYTGMQHDVCEAGVNYTAAFGDEAGRGCRAPCLQEYKTHERVDGKYVPKWLPWPRRGQTEIPCDKRLMPTAEQIAEADAAIKRYLEKSVLALRIAHEWKTWTESNRVEKNEVVECPVCKGRLHLSQSAHNGHIWGKCETEGCVSWME